MPKLTKVPKRLSDFPDGVYRTQLSTAKLEKLAIFDTGAQGTWTLTVKAGTFRLECQPMKDAFLDCGGGTGDVKRHTVDYGTLHGNGSTVWFVHDMVYLTKTYGCVRNSASPRWCGPEGGFHMTWRRLPAAIEFSHFVGLGDEAGVAPGWWEPQPWTRIA